MDDSEIPDLSRLPLQGGHLALDFANSVDPRDGPGPAVDYLPDFHALCAWAAHAAMISPARAAVLQQAGAEHPRRSRQVWRRAIALREALFRTVSALATGRDPQEDDLDLLTAELREGLARTELRPSDGRKGASAFELALGESGEPESVLWPLARAAGDLLSNADVSRLRSCPVELGGCGWVVLDTTRNRSRRWCDMGACGNEAKARRLTERRRAARSRETPR
jgi:predicted RNA-binding Zn ribbon-like protein